MSRSFTRTATLKIPSYTEENTFFPLVNIGNLCHQIRSHTFYCKTCYEESSVLFLLIW